MSENRKWGFFTHTVHVQGEVLDIFSGVANLSH